MPDARPLDYEPRRHRSTRAKIVDRIGDALSIALALALPAWAFWLVMHLSARAARPFTAGDDALIVGTIALPIAFAVAVCAGPVARR